MKDKLLNIWFVVSVFGMAVLYFLLDRKGRKVEQLIHEAAKQKLAAQLAEIKERSKRSTYDFNQAMADYDALKRRHPDLVTKYGLVTGRGSKADN